MNEQKAMETLKDFIERDNSLYLNGRYVAWNLSDKKITLDDDFTADELEAMAWWMRNYGESE